MKRALIAGALYFAGAFALGFALGVLRTALVEPRVGKLLAVLAELPLMLTACWFLCRGVTEIVELPATAGARLAMGLLAFALLLAAEAALFRLLFALRPLDDFVADLVTPAGLAGLAAQGLFALCPLAQGRRAAS